MNDWLRTAAQRTIALVLLCLLCGCRSAPPTRLDRSVANLPATARDNVHVYLVGSPIDAAELGGLPSLKDNFRELGFENTKHITWTTASGLADRIALDHQRDPECHTLLIGWSLGCYQILEAASLLEQERKIEVDRVICLDGNPWIGWQGKRHHYPSTTENVVCIYPPHRNLPEGMAKTRQRIVKASHHFAVPLHEETIETILHEIAAVTEEVQIAESAPSVVARQTAPPDPERHSRSVGEAQPARAVVRTAHWHAQTDNVSRQLQLLRSGLSNE